MTQTNIFYYQNYKRFLIEWIDGSPQHGRGLRKELAKAVGCQMAFITHVLAGDYHFSLEQAEACCHWLKLSDPEADFFILLVLFERAGTKNLRARLRRQILTQRETYSTLKSKINVTESLPIEDQITYYSSWLYAAIHMAILNSKHSNVESLCTLFHLSQKQIEPIIEFLIDKGFITAEKSKLKVIKPVLHLEHNSPLISQHHTQWRIKAIDSLNPFSPDSLHYSGVISLSDDDYQWVSERLSSLLKDIVSKLKHSPDEKLACLNFDWFQIN